MKYQGKNAGELFKNGGNISITRQVYESAKDIYLRLLEKSAKRKKTLCLFDFGGYQGEWSSKLKRELKKRGLEIEVTGLDILEYNARMQYDRYIRADLIRKINQDSNGNVGILRFVLPWNKEEDQIKIIRNCLSVLDGYLILENVGPIKGEESHFRRMNREIFSENNKRVAKKLYRQEHCFRSVEEVVSDLEKEGIPYEVIRRERLTGLEELFIEKYALNKDQKGYLRRMFKPFKETEKSLILLTPN